MISKRDAERREDVARSAARREDALDVFMVFVDGEFTPAGSVSAQVQWWNYLGFVASGLGSATRNVRSLFMGQLEELRSRLAARYPAVKDELPADAAELSEMSAADLLGLLLTLGEEPTDRGMFETWAVARRYALELLVSRLDLCADAWNGLVTGADRRGRTLLRASARAEGGSERSTTTGFE
ncbi:hypothetical protein [Kutzneria sp. NPDC051319]|uniref:hypothetical protein n=1 Tax=Kutzneria sp. NPDC051319 TaxID=3155047 RepID=UPI00343663EE